MMKLNDTQHSLQWEKKNNNIQTQYYLYNFIYKTNNQAGIYLFQVNKKHQNNVCNPFQINYKRTRTALMLTLNK